MKNVIKLSFEDGNLQEVMRGITVLDLLKKINIDDDVIALRINGELVPANYEIMNDSTVEFIKVADRIGMKIYIKGLEFVYTIAVKQVLGNKAYVRIKHSLDKAIYTEVFSKKRLTSELVKEIKARMKEIIKSDYTIHKVNSNRKDAIDYFTALNEEEKVLNYTYMTPDYITLYELLDEYNYFYYIMPASTGILKRFDLTHVSPSGIVLSYPIDNVVPKYNPSPKVLEAFKNSEDKFKKLGVSYAGDINKIVCDAKINDFILANEMLYDEDIFEVVSKVMENRNIRTILISGPSSSGKTTTSKKLSLALRTKGIDSLVLSTDDYFLNRIDSPRKPNGDYEYEIVDALDIKLFNTHLKQLLSGEDVVVPSYNFMTGEKEFKRKPIKLKEGQLLIVEGLHAINEKLSTCINKKNKLKIYISPFTPISLDRHNHISTTDIRLLRRMVRDYKHRGYSAEETINRWAGMRSSEAAYVYPYQREADLIVNTSLAYEIGVIRTYVEPLLYSIKSDSDNYEEAIRILNFLKGFISIPETGVPYTSVLREFIGNSYFE